MVRVSVSTLLVASLDISALTFTTIPLSGDQTRIFILVALLAKGIELLNPEPKLVPAHAWAELVLITLATLLLESVGSTTTELALPPKSIKL